MKLNLSQASSYQEFAMTQKKLKMIRKERERLIIMRQNEQDEIPPKCFSRPLILLQSRGLPQSRRVSEAPHS